MSDDRAGRLLELTVTDLALIDRLRLTLGAGLNVITGETGAGKSLIIDALGLALGERADTSLVRHGAETARVEALFDHRPEPRIAVREVAANGRSTARLDDATVTAARLADEVGPLVEIHGQHDQQRLLDERWQRDLLDGYGGHGDAPCGRWPRPSAAWRENQAAMAELSVSPHELVRRLELAEYEASEIAAARLRPGEADEIRGRLAAGQHGESIARGSALVHDALTGEPGGAREATAQALREARSVARVDPRFEPLVERLAGLEAELADVAAEARTLAESVEHDPRAIAALEERLGAIYALERRYGEGEATVIAHGERAAAEAERLRGLEGERARREADDARLLAAVAVEAAALSAARAETASRPDRGRLVGARGTRVPGRHLRRLARPSCRPARMNPRSSCDGDACAFDAAGADLVVFVLAPNPGEPARPLARIASGGEMSRVALAIKQVLAEADETPTLVFDEVDAGIGGRSADPVGRSLWALGRRHQVLCVTHLPQIAAHADVHYRIAKRERDGRTVTEVEALDREGRIVELAQMLGGEGGGQATMASARELLDRAEAWRGEAAGVG